MRFARVRSGVTESIHDAAAIAIDADGGVLLSSGDVDFEFFYRSAIKPLQAAVARRTGLDLPPEHLAVTCASHGGYPVHLAIVERILEDHGLDASALRTTKGLPLGSAARDVQRAAHRLEPSSLFHNCSGKHAGFLAACVVAGYDTDTYLLPDHPLQRSIIEFVGDLAGVNPEPVGVDGCGAPTLRGSVRALATAFSRFGTEPEFRPIVDAVDRFMPLVADNTRPDGVLGVNWTGASKAGAEGCIALTRNGLTVAAKSMAGNAEIAVAAATEVIAQLDLLPSHTMDHIEHIRRPPVVGGGRIVGKLELVES